MLSAVRTGLATMLGIACAVAMVSCSGAGGEPPGVSATGSRAAVRAWPAPSTTGVRDAARLTTHEGSVLVKDAGSTIQDLEIHGVLQIAAPGVQVRNVRVVGAVTVDPAGYGVTLTDVEVDHSAGPSSEAAVGPGGFTCTRCYIHGEGHGVHMEVDRSALVDSYVEITDSRDETHKDAVITNGGARGLMIRGNVLTCASEGCTAAVGLFGDFGAIDDVVIERNLLNTTGGYCLHAGVGAPGKPYSATRVRVIDNTFGTTYHPRCGEYGPVAYWGDSHGNEWTGNVLGQAGAPVSP